MTFDCCYCINLKRRPDRWIQFQADFPPELPTVCRFEACDGQLDAPPAWWRGTRGAWGCTLSHIRIFEESLNLGRDSILIFEDDALASHTQVGRDFLRFVAALPDDWQWVYFGGCLYDTVPQRINSDVYRPRFVGGAHAYAVRRSTMLRLFHALQDSGAYAGILHYGDQLYMKLQRDSPCSGLYCPPRWLFDQRCVFSDIEESHKPHQSWPSAMDIT